MTLDKIFIPAQSVLEDRFKFVQDETLRTNIIITFRYIIFLIELEQKEKLPGPIIYTLYKDMIVQAAIVVESCVHYALKCFIDKGIVKSSEVMEEEWKEEKCIILEEVGDKQICGVIRHKSANRFYKHTQFLNLNRACLKSDIYTKDVFDKAERLREARNKIHLAGLSKVDDLYKKDDVDKYFEYAGVVLTRLEEKLAKI